MKVIYIAGPYRAKTEYGVKHNIDVAAEYALAIWELGGVALCPHKNTAFFGGARGIPDETWLKGDLELLSRCDAVWMMDNWANSQGASAEREYALKIGKPVFYGYDEVADFLQGGV